MTTANRMPTRAEVELLRKIHEGLGPETWDRYRELVARRRAEKLTPEEHAELIALSDRIEEANARRIGYVAELADLRKTTLPELMDELGIAPADV